MPDLTPDTWAQIRAAYEHSDRPVADICAEHGISTGTLRDRVRRWRWTRRRPPISREGPPAVAAPREFASPPPISAANGGEGSPAAAEAMAGLITRPPKRSEGGSGVGGLGAMTTIDPPTPLRLADASRSDPPHRFAGGGMEHAAPLHDIEAPTTTPTPDPSPQEPAPGRAQARPGWGGEPANPAAIVPRLQGAVARVLPAIEATIAKLAAGPQAPREMEQTARALGTMMRTLRELNALLAQQPLRAAADDDDMPEDIDAFRLELARRIRAFVADRAARGNAAAAEAARAPDDDMPEDIDAFREQLARKIDAFMESRGDEEFEDEPER